MIRLCGAVMGALARFHWHVRSRGRETFSTLLFRLAQNTTHTTFPSAPNLGIMSYSNGYGQGRGRGRGRGRGGGQPPTNRPPQQRINAMARTSRGSRHS
jgi:hypothetical protein